MGEEERVSVRRRGDPRGVALIEVTHTEYEYLKQRDQELSALEAGGVDNWEGYSDSLKEAGLLGDEEDV